MVAYQRDQWEPKEKYKIYVWDHPKYNKNQEFNDKMYFISDPFIFNYSFLIFSISHFVKYERPETPSAERKKKSKFIVTGLLISSSLFLWALGNYKEVKLWIKE